MATPNHSVNPAGQREALTAEKTAVIALEAVAAAIARLRYGAIGLTIHDGRVVQIEVTERQRFT
ncbi:MAG TPA: YezD family protein [Novosphingobium sp.]